MSSLAVQLAGHRLTALAVYESLTTKSSRENYEALLSTARPDELFAGLVSLLDSLVISFAAVCGQPTTRQDLIDILRQSSLLMQDLTS